MTYGGGPITVKVEAAFGADPDDDATWAAAWVDISSDLLTPQGGLGAAVTIKAGRQNESGVAAPTDVRFVLKNFNGQYTPGLATGAHYPNVKRNTPIRISLSGVSATDPRVRATVFVYEIIPGWDDSLRVAVVSIGAAGRLRRLQQGAKVLRSPMTAAALGASPAPYAYWPLEDGVGATRASSAVAGVDPAIAYGLTFASDSTATGSNALPVLGTTGVIQARIPAYTATGQASAMLALNIPAAPANTTELLRISGNGTAASWAARIVPASPDTLNIRADGPDGTNLLSATVNLDETLAYGNWTVVTIDLTQNGADVDYAVNYVYTSGSSVGKTGTLAAKTVGTIATAKVAVSASGDLVGSSVGHLGFWNDPTFAGAVFSGLAYNINPIAMGILDTPNERYQFLANAAGLNGIAGTVGFAGAETQLYMGASPIGSVIDGWRECEVVDGGIIHDADIDSFIIFVTRASHYNAAVSMSIAMSAHELQNPFQPVLDDQLIVTESTITVRDGSSATFATDIGEGTYTDPQTLNLLDDQHAYEIAGWRVHKGTLAGMRYPKVTINLRRAPGLADEWLACAIGSRITIVTVMDEHPPDTVDLELVGYTERVSPRWWDAELVCTPFAPYVVGTLDSATLGHLSATSLVLAGGGWNGSAGTFTTTAATALCTTAAGNYPLDLNIGGQRVTVSGCSGSSNPQTFTVSVASVNGVVKTHAAGDAVELWQPLRLAL